MVSILSMSNYSNRQQNLVAPAGSSARDLTGMANIIIAFCRKNKQKQRSKTRTRERAVGKMAKNGSHHVNDMTRKVHLSGLRFT